MKVEDAVKECLKAEQLILNELENKVLSAAEIVENIKSKIKIKSSNIKSAIWHLLDKNKIEFTADNNLKIKKLT